MLHKERVNGQSTKHTENYIAKPFEKQRGTTICDSVKN